MIPELEQENVVSRAGGDAVDLPLCDVDSAEDRNTGRFLCPADSWLTDDRVKVYTRSVQYILNVLRMCIIEEEELSELWAKLNSVNTSAWAMSQGLRDGKDLV